MIDILLKKQIVKMVFIHIATNVENNCVRKRKKNHLKKLYYESYKINYNKITVLNCSQNCHKLKRQKNGRN